jgi:hypothetical protein
MEELEIRHSVQRRWRRPILAGQKLLNLMPVTRCQGPVMGEYPDHQIPAKTRQSSPLVFLNVVVLVFTTNHEQRTTDTTSPKGIAAERILSRTQRFHSRFPRGFIQIWELRLLMEAEDLGYQVSFKYTS